MAKIESVQELSFKGYSEVPERYVHTGNNGGMFINGTSSLPLLDIPLIDISRLMSPSSEGIEEISKLQSALKDYGFFQATSHGMTDKFLGKLQEMGKEFFALPMEEKLKYGTTPENVVEGYGNDSKLSPHQSVDWIDRLLLVVSPEDKRSLKLWPKNPECFREVLEEYTMKLKILNEGIFKAMARSLNLEEDCFLKQYGESPAMRARFNFYPTCPRPDLTFGLRPHSDASAITFLLQDKEVEGLQVMKDDQWFRIRADPYAVLVIVGDQVEIMSNGIFKSLVHRVVTNSEKERSSLVVFCAPGSEMEIGPVEKLINEEKPRLYMTLKDYVRFYFQNYSLGSGKRPIEATKI